MYAHYLDSVWHPGRLISVPIENHETVIQEILATSSIENTASGENTNCELYNINFITLK